MDDMSTTNQQPIYTLLPAIYRARDAVQGGPLAAFFSVLESQYGIVRENLLRLYDDQFIETCAPWVIPYIGELIGYDPIYTAALASPDSRAEVANTIGYRRRKGTLLAMEQLTRDVSGRNTLVVEEFKRLITTLSLRDVRPRHDATANLRRGRDWQDQNGPFSRLNRTIDVHRIAPRAPSRQSPDPTPLDIALHGPGRNNIPDVAIWIWRCQSRAITNAPAFPLSGGGYAFSALGGPIPLFQQPPPAPSPFERLFNEADAPQPISRRDFATRMSQFYPSNLQLIADGTAVDVSQIVCANLTEAAGGTFCRVPSGKIAIDPELGRIRYASDLTPPAELRVNYCYGSPAEMAGGPYDRTASITAPPAAPSSFLAVVGTPEFPTLEQAVAAWNQQPSGATGVIVLPNFESYVVDLTGPNAVQISPQSQLLLAAAEVASGTPPVWVWTNSCVTLRGALEVVGLPAPNVPSGTAPPLGQVQISGIWLSGELRLNGVPACVQITDSTLVPGRSLTAQGEPAFAGEPSIRGSMASGSLCLTRIISGPIALPESCNVRMSASVLDAGSTYRPAYAGGDLASPGAELHIEDLTVIGRVLDASAQARVEYDLPSTVGKARSVAGPSLGPSPPGGLRALLLVAMELGHAAALRVPASRRRLAAALQLTFITLRFGQPAYCLLSGDAPLAIWKGADNGSQIGVYLGIQETEAVANVQISLPGVSAGQSGTRRLSYSVASRGRTGLRHRGLRLRISTTSAAARRAWRAIR